MKSKLPFRLSAAGLFSLAVGQALYSPVAGADVTVTAAGAVTAPAAVDSLAAAILSSSGAPVTATVNTGSVQNSIAGATAADMAITGSQLSATATANTASLMQQITSGEDAVATGLSSRAVNGSTVSATLTNSSFGASASGAVSGAASVTVSGNSSTATARANDGTTGLVATGAQGGAAGGNAAVAATLGTDVVTTGDLSSGAYQSLSQSNVTALSENGVTGLQLTGATAAFTATGGLTVDGNSVGATAGGNRLAVTLSENLTGSDVDAAVGTVQQGSDTNITATAAGNRLGVHGSATGASVSGVPLSVTGNQLATAASGNTLSSTVEVDLTSSNDSAVVSSTQNLSAATAGTADYQVSARTQDAVIGAQVNNTAIANASTSVTGNTVSASTSGQSLVDRVQAAPGSIAGSLSLTASQSLSATNDGLAFNAQVGDDSLDVIVGIDANAAGGGFTGGNLSIADNLVRGSALANSATQVQGDLIGSVDGPVSTSLTQNAVQTGSANDIAVVTDVEDVTLGIASINALDGTSISIANNRIAGVAGVNQASSVQGAINGTTTAAIDLSASQTATSADASSTLDTPYVGVRDANADIAINGDVNLLVTGNRLSSQAEVNRVEQSVGSLSGNLGAGLSASTSQIANRVDGDNANATSSIASASLGVDGVTADIGAGGNALDLQVSGNQITSSANTNVALRQVGAVTGTINATYSRSSNQEASNNAAGSSVSALSLGLAGFTGALANTSDGVAIDVSGNSVASSARRNVYTEQAAGVSGRVATSAAINTTAVQDATGGNVTSSLSNLGLGITGHDNSLGLGTTADGTSLSIVDNQLRSDVSVNLAAGSLGGVSGDIDGTVSQSLNQTTTVVVANSSIGETVIGQGMQSATATIGAGGAVATSVAGNSAVAALTANSGELDLGGFSGSLGATGQLRSTGTQTANAVATASVNTVRIGIDDNSTIAAATSPVSTAVTDNLVQAAGTLNSLSSTLGAIVGEIDGLVLSSGTQEIQVGADLDVTASNTEVGLTSFLGLGTGASAPVTVDGNRVAATGSGNVASVTGSLVGDLGGSVVVQNSQTAAYGTSTYTATVNTAAIGEAGSGTGSNVRAAVTDNSVLAAISGNRLSTSFDDFTVSQGASSASFTGTQTNTGGAANDTELAATVTGATVGVFTFGSTLGQPDASVTGNQLASTATGNDVARFIGGLGGQLNGGGLQLSDTQLNTNLGVSATLSNSQIGSSANTTGAIPLNLVTSDNVAVAEAVGNRAVQTVQLAGLNVGSTADVNLIANQSNIGGTVTANVNTMRVGFSTLGTGVFNGGAVSSGNSVGANAVGNTARLSRGR